MGGGFRLSRFREARSFTIRCSAHRPADGSLRIRGTNRYSEVLPKLGLMVSQKSTTRRSGGTSDTPTRRHFLFSPASRECWMRPLASASSSSTSSSGSTARGVVPSWELSFRCDRRFPLRFPLKVRWRGPNSPHGARVGRRVTMRYISGLLSPHPPTKGAGPLPPPPTSRKAPSAAFARCAALFQKDLGFYRESSAEDPSEDVADCSTVTEEV